MKKTISICFFAVCLLAGIGSILAFREPRPDGVRQVKPSSEMPDMTAETEQPDAAESMTVQKPFHYILREQDGILVVYEEDGETVLLETNINVVHLDERTRGLLVEGIYVESEEELYDLLESYSS